MIDKEFADRLTKACDDMPKLVPPHGEGRLVVLAQKLKVSQEAARKWLSGDARPRVRKLQELAAFLHIDPAWLALGVEPDIRPQDLRFFHRQTEGVVYLALGLAMIEGAQCAPPDEADPRKAFIDFNLIQDGSMAAVRTSLGLKRDGYFDFVVPHEYAQVRNVGFVWNMARSTYTMLDLR